MKNIVQLLTVVLASLIIGCSNEEPVNQVPPTIEPPYGGTVWITPNIITDDDPSSFRSIEPTGIGTRTMYDRRIEDWIEVDAHLFDVTYEDDKKIEIQVNPEFNATYAEHYAEEYAIYIGRLPREMFRDLETVWVHDGDESFGGGNNNILIHVGLAKKVVRDGFMEEILLHEGSHTSLDSYHADAPKWQEAQRKDPTFISTYARDHSTREDIAETFPLYFALRYRPESLTEEQRTTILATIPHRIAYFDDQEIDYYPFGN